MKILCLLAHTVASGKAGTTKRIMPLMRKLVEKGHEVEIQENLAMNEASPGERKYFFARQKYRVQCVSSCNDSYDLIFASKPELGILAYLLSKKLHIPFVLDVDDLEKVSRLDIFGQGTHLLVKKATRVFVASIGLYRIFRKTTRDIVYLPNTTDLEYFNPSKYENIKNNDEPAFIWVSGVRDWLVECRLLFNSLSKLQVGRIYIIGKASPAQKKYCIELGKNLGLKGRVMVKGWVPDDEVPQLYKASDIGLLPFNTTLWSDCKCPSRLFEFIAMQLPFICTVGEPAYMARKLGSGLIAKPEIEDFTDKMKYAIDNLEELKESAKRGRKYLLEKQNFNVLAEKLEAELYNALTVT